MRKYKIKLTFKRFRDKWAWEVMLIYRDKYYKRRYKILEIVERKFNSKVLVKNDWNYLMKTIKKIINY